MLVACIGNLNCTSSLYRTRRTAEVSEPRETLRTSKRLPKRGSVGSVTSTQAVLASLSSTEGVSRKEFLNQTDVGTIFKKVRSETMAQRMGRGRLADAGQSQCSLDDALHGAR